MSLIPKDNTDFETKDEDTGKHYRFTYKGIKLDPCRICEVYGVTHGMQHAIVKKALMAGRRGHKDKIHDIKDIITAANRWLEMINEDLSNEWEEPKSIVLNKNTDDDILGR